MIIVKIIRPMIMRTINNLSYNPIYKDYSCSDLIMFFVWIPILLIFFLSLHHSRKAMDIFAIATIVVCLPFWGTQNLRFSRCIIYNSASMPYIIQNP